LADEKNVTLEQFKGFMTKADERLDKLEVGKENKVSPVSITIPTEGWASEEIGETDEEGTEASYPFYYDIAAADVTAKHRADVTISRESLDCAYALQQLRTMGVKNIITFDAHDPRVMNAVPLMSFDNVMPTYQVLKCLLHHVPDVDFSKEQFLVVSPDEGAMNRNMYYSSVLGCNLGMFYKRRDYSRVVNGRNPIVAHEYLGEDVKGKDVFIADDIIASGESMLDIGYELKMRGAKNIFTCATFPLFTAGLDKFDKAYNDGIIKAVLGTNLTYRKPELLERPWYFDVDLSKYTAYFIAAINHDMSVSSIIDPMTKIKHLLDNHGIPIGNQE